MKPHAGTREHVWSALSMIPGIPLAIYWLYSSKNKNIRISALLYIITCTFSFIYHVKCAADEGYHPKWLRLDITGQQSLIYVTAVLFQGVGGAAVLAPFAVLIALLDFGHNTESYIALAVHALSILVTTSITNFRVGLQWLVAFIVYSFKEVNPKYFSASQSLWHLLCHLNMASLWTVLV